jgi:hypothetical protein
MLTTFAYKVVTRIEILGFRTLSIVRIFPKYQWKTQRFGNWICFRPQVREDTTQLGPLERANLNHWTRLARDVIYHNSIEFFGETLINFYQNIQWHIPEDNISYSFQNFEFLDRFLIFQSGNGGGGRFYVSAPVSPADSHSKSCIFFYHFVIDTMQTVCLARPLSIRGYGASCSTPLVMKYHCASPGATTFMPQRERQRRCGWEPPWRRWIALQGQFPLTTSLNNQLIELNTVDLIRPIENKHR